VTRDPVLLRRDEARPAGQGPPSGWRWAAAAIPGALVFVFPSVVATTDGGGSWVYVLLLVAGLVLGRGWPELEAREKRVLLAMVAVLPVMALGLVNATDLGMGLTRLERFARIAAILPIYLMFRRTGLPLHRRLGWGAILATVVMAGQAWYQTERLGLDKAMGFYHHIVFGDLAVLWGCLGVLFALTCLRTWVGLAVGSTAAAAATYAAVLSQARGAWLAVPVLLVAGGWLAWRFDRRDGPVHRRFRWGGVAVLLTVVGLGVWQAGPVGERLMLAASDLESFSEDPSAETSWGIRLNLWRNSLLLARDHPLLGIGPGQFNARMQDMVADGRSLNPWVTEYSHAHSIYFDALVSAGVLGLVAMMAGYLFLPFRTFGGMLDSVRTAGGRYCAIGGVLTVLAFATFGLSEALWTRNPFVTTYVLCIAVLLSGSTSGAMQPPGQTPPQR
jgi:O-antigen ligase